MVPARVKTRSDPRFRAQAAARPCRLLSAVGWRDRDWGKFDDGEWDSYVASKAPRPGGTRRTAAGGMALLLAVGLSAAGYFVLHTEPVKHSVISLPIRRAAPTEVIGIRWSESDLAPAATAGRICVTDPAHGRICAAYALGEKPADALTRQLAALGLSVRSSG